MRGKITRTFKKQNVAIIDSVTDEIIKTYEVQGTTDEYKEGKKYSKESGKFSFYVKIETIEETRVMDIDTFISNSKILVDEPKED